MSDPVSQMAEDERRMRAAMADLETMLNKMEMPIHEKMVVAMNFGIGFLATNGFNDEQLRQSFEAALQLNPAITMKSIQPAGHA